MHGRAATVDHRHKPVPIGFDYVHVAIDDHSRLAYVEVLPDERVEACAGFLARAVAWFATHHVTVARVLTDNGACYRSRDFATALGPVIHTRTRPYRPATNGKVERFHRTLADEWAYATAYISDADRAAAYPAWLHRYNHHRGHTALGGHPPPAASPTCQVRTASRGRRPGVG